jgi:hypothetical protein
MDAEHEVTWCLSEEGMDLLERAGLAALYMALRAANEAGIDLSPLTWSDVSERMVEAARPGVMLTNLLKRPISQGWVHVPGTEKVMPFSAQHVAHDEPSPRTHSRPSCPRQASSPVHSTLERRWNMDQQDLEHLPFFSRR